MLQLNYRDATPIYEQIKDGMCRLILTEVLKPEEQLPSVRDMASRLAINPNTIAKAYKELEHEGYIYSIKGKGTFVSSNSSIYENRKEELMYQFDCVVEELILLSITRDELKKRIDDLEEGER